MTTRLDSLRIAHPRPVRLRFCLSAALAPGLSVALSGAYADWSGTGDDLAAATTGGGTTALGAGLEWDRAVLLGRGLPIRLGWRRAELPFRFDDSDPVETTYGGGIGLVLAVAGETPLARLDFAVERGRRDGGSVAEDFWRSTITFRADALIRWGMRRAATAAACTCHCRPDRRLGAGDIQARSRRKGQHHKPVGQYHDKRVGSRHNRGHGDGRRENRTGQIEDSRRLSKRDHIGPG